MRTQAQTRASPRALAVTPHAAVVLSRIPDVGARRSLTRLATEVSDLLNIVYSLGGLARELPRHSHELHERLAIAWPVARAALAAGDRLRSTLRERLPEHAANEDELDFDNAFGEQTVVHSREDAQAGLRGLEWAIHHELDRVRGLLASPIPDDHDDSWRALVALQEFRGRLRNAVGELVFEAFRTHAPLSREDVIPGYGEELADSLALRRAVATMARRVLPLCLRVKLAQRMDLGAAVLDLARSVGDFCASPAFAALRLSDRHTTQELHKRLEHLAQAPAPMPARDLSEDLGRFVESLSAISRREMLILHDRDVVQSSRRQLQSFLAEEANEPFPSNRPFFRAFQQARALEGAAPNLDAFFAWVDGWPGSVTTDAVIKAAGELLAQLDTFAPGGPARASSAWDRRG